VRYGWPGNVRERANVLERAQVLAEGEWITPDDLPDNLIPSGPDAGGGAQAQTRDLHGVQRRHIQAVLREARGNKVQAARALGISRRALYRLLDKYHLQGPGGARGRAAGPAPLAPAHDLAENPAGPRTPPACPGCR
jgi:DNA-binding NtrC family response regulator